MNASQKHVPVTVNLGVDQRKRVQQLANVEDRSFSAIVRRALTAQLDRATTAVTRDRRP